MKIILLLGNIINLDGVKTVSPLYLFAGVTYHPLIRVKRESGERDDFVDYSLEYPESESAVSAAQVKIVEAFNSAK